MDIDRLVEKKLEDLRKIAKALGVPGFSRYNKKELIDEIARQTRMKEEAKDETYTGTSAEEADQAETRKVSGILDLHADGYGFMRSNGYDSGDDDIYVPPVQVRRFGLKTGDYIQGLSRERGPKEKFSPLIYVNQVNGETVGDLRSRPNFEDLTPIYPQEKIILEGSTSGLANRLIDLVAPLGKGQRGLIVSPPKAGKTTLLKAIAHGIHAYDKDIHIIVLLIDERPEEVTDMQRSIPGEVVASTFDEFPQNHTRLAEIVLERAKRLVEHQRDVVVLVDSITRLSRAYNVTSPYSGKTLSGGLDPMALSHPKRFFGAARNIEEGGSLTILATALVDTGSRMDDVIFEEFKGTGNMEIHLKPSLSELRIFPAIDLLKSGTRREELLQDEASLAVVGKIREALYRTKQEDQVLNQTLQMLARTQRNQDFVESIETVEFIS